MISSDPSLQLKIISPDPAEWLVSEKLKFISQNLSPVYNLLRSSSLLNDVIAEWVKSEVIKDIDIAYSDASKLPDDEKLLAWCRSQWKHKLESLYLEKKDDLDTVDCKILAVPDKNLSFELYYRLKAGEAEFEELSIRYGIGPERFRGGLFEKQSLSSFPLFLRKRFKSTRPGELLKPFRSGDTFTILLLERFSLAAFDTDSQNRLLLWEFKDWQQGIIESTRRHLEQLNE